jgi:hypothetical protein
MGARPLNISIVLEEVGGVATVSAAFYDEVAARSYANASRHRVHVCSVSDAAYEKTLTGIEQNVHESLLEKLPGLAAMYLGSRICFNDETNPESLHLTAHCMRELMEKLPEAQGIRMRGDRLGPRVEKVLEIHRRIKTELELDPKSSSNTRSLQLLQELDSLDTWIADNRNKRSDGALKVVQSFQTAPSQRLLAVEGPIANRWLDLNDYFVAVGHHKSTTRDEMSKKLREFDDLMLPMLRPQPTENTLSILDLIRKAEND